jgi:hypothetical protein
MRRNAGREDEARLLRYITELVWRDPMTRKLLALTHPDRFEEGSQEHAAAERKLLSLRRQLRTKYGVDVIPRPPAGDSAEAAPYLDDVARNLWQDMLQRDPDAVEAYSARMFRRGAPAVHISLQSDLAPLRYTLNNGCLRAGLQLRFAWEHPRAGEIRGFGSLFSYLCHFDDDDPMRGWHARRCLEHERSGLDLDHAHSVTVTVNLARVGRDLSVLKAAFGRLLRHALRFAPPRMGRLRDDLTRLLTVPRARFVRALSRYDRHADGKTVRAIAREDRATADAVERDIRLIAEAIFRKPYRLRRRRLDAPAQGASAFECSTHGRNCPDTCPRPAEWLARLRPSLPSDRTGMGRRPGRSPEAEEARQARRGRTPPRNETWEDAQEAWRRAGGRRGSRRS